MQLLPKLYVPFAVTFIFSRNILKNIRKKAKKKQKKNQSRKGTEVEKLLILK